MNNDLAGKSYWNEVWRLSNTRAINLRNYYHHRLEKLFRRLISPHSKILEIGCGNSRWLPYFAKYYQAEVWGIDYSEVGVEFANQNLISQNVSGNIVLGDVLTTEKIPIGYFDVIWSSGFIEHFNTPHEIIDLVKKFIKPHGFVISVVPNLEGCIGWLHKTVDSEIYEKHVVINAPSLDFIHTHAGLKVINPAHYFGVFSVGVVNFSRIRKSLPRFIDKLFWYSILIFQQLVCLPFRLTGLKPESKLFSPYIIGVYQGE